MNTSRTKKKAESNPRSAADGEAGLPLGEVAKRYIIGGIKAGKYKPGTHLPEREICDSLGISRTPVREAIRQLQVEGVLVVKPHLGVVVGSLSARQISEVYALRMVLEAFVCKNAAKFASDSEIFLMENILERALATNDDLQEFDILNKRFHKTLYAAARNEYVAQVLDNLDLTFSLLPGLTYEIEGRMEEANEEHLGLLNAIKSRDPDLAEKLAEQHMESALRARLKISISQMD